MKRLLTLLANCIFSISNSRRYEVISCKILHQLLIITLGFLLLSLLIFRRFLDRVLINNQLLVLGGLLLLTPVELLLEAKAAINRLCSITQLIGATSTGGPGCDASRQLGRSHPDTSKPPLFPETVASLEALGLIACWRQIALGSIPVYSERKNVATLSRSYLVHDGRIADLYFYWLSLPLS